ncbi:hypothetical protein [Chromohalobacter sp. HP20-39]|uniref:hypothetical protein n=1 Tax=Chromohalobacter sp. HP20-39 TaxID=3079306 RepID=UPI00294B643E|nr:hypothetical protein [Chromohalobacter sp. HP20-39]MDV6319594.1 hypothetical protein [Chromohalobacter sp. HP20-39]
MKRTDPQMKIRLEPAVKAWIETKAKADDRPQTWLINQLLKEVMQHSTQRAS